MLLHKGAQFELVADSPILAPHEVTVVCEANTVLAQARQEAEALLARAHAEIAAMHAAASAHAEQVRDQAERDAQNALNEAQQLGLEQGRQAAAMALAESARSSQTQARAMESYVVRAVLIGIRTILGQIPADERMRYLVARAVAQVEIPGSLSLYVHPDDAAAAARGLNDLPDGGGAAIRIVADAALPVGACRLQSDYGTVEAGLASQLEVLTQALVRVAGARGLAHPDASKDNDHP